MENHFVLPKEEYSRDLNILNHYVEDSALYLHKRTGKSLDVCRDYVKRNTAPGGKLGITDPDVMSLTKHKPGHREKEQLKLSAYLRDMEDNDRIVSPTMAVYYNPTVKPSLSSDFIGINIQRRNESKHAMFSAKEAGDKAMEEFKKNEQKSFKISNNSLSGAQASAHTVLYNKSAHSSLTSTCRTATSYGNANNEKFLFGNRHYWGPDVVKANITSILRSTNYEALSHAMDLYGIRHPTIAETFECIRYSTDLYWKNDEELRKIYALVETLSDIERSAFVYSGDLYHLAKYNDEVVRVFLDKLSSKATVPIDDPDVYIDQMDADLNAFVGLLCAEELSGKSIKAIKKEGGRDYQIVGATAKHILEVLDEYQHLIKAFWRINTLPSSIAHIRSSIRRGVITSDTDSTIFTVQYWTEWYVGQIDFSEKSNAIAYAVVYLATQTIAHILAMVSAGMGVRPDMIHDLSMKNEFAFPVFVLTSMAKHYFAYISAQEGNVFTELDTEVKGVYLKDSNCPPHVMEEFNKTLRWTMDRVMDGGGINITELYQKISTIENGIRESVRKGESSYLTGSQVKNKESYANPMSSPYLHYLLWNEVFAPKYGEAPEPPYSAVKVSIDIKNKTAMQEWLDKIEDRELATRLMNWIKANNKNAITSILLPRPVVDVTGLPEEIIQAMNIRKLIYSTVKPFYILLESLGVYMTNNNITRLVSDSAGQGQPTFVPHNPA